MGRRSVRKNKTIFQQIREVKGLSREAACERLGSVSNSRLVRIESGETPAYPEEVVLMAEAYGEPNLPNLYCANECPLGKNYIPEIEVKELPIITLETLNLLNRLTKQKDRLIEISADGELTPDEYRDFLSIRKDLEQMSMVIDSMQLWIENRIVDGTIPEEILSRTEEQQT